MTEDGLAETLISSEELVQGRILTLSRDRVGLPGGGETTRDVVHHRGAAAIVALTATERVLLVRQWRHPVARALWELPAGTIDEGEEPQMTAQRELAEETGHSAKAWRRLGSAPLAPGYSSEVMHFFLARELHPVAAIHDADENLEVGEFGMTQVRDLVLAGELDVKTVAGLALAGLWK